MAVSNKTGSYIFISCHTLKHFFYSSVENADNSIIFCKKFQCILQDEVS